MKPKFVINELGAQSERSVSFKQILSEEILSDICFRLTGKKIFTIEWRKSRNVGRSLLLRTSNKEYFITLSQGDVRSRNSYFQSVPTAYGIFLHNQSKVSSDFCFYFLPGSGNKKTKYMLFMYNLLKTVGVHFINPDSIKLTNISLFSSTKEIIEAKNNLRGKNLSNQSTYITDEGSCYHIYGKTFGANQKETTIICFAICKTADKPVKLFQIVDNESRTLSQNDINSISLYASRYNTKPLCVLDDSYIFHSEEDSSEISSQENLRDPKFVYNLLRKSNGIKKCTLCNCYIESIIQAAHIYPVKDIKKRRDLSYEKKLELATDSDNGIWLCENHHKLFDRGLIYFKKDAVAYSKKLMKRDLEFVKCITSCAKIPQSVFNRNMQNYFSLRDIVYSSEY